MMKLIETVFEQQKNKVVTLFGEEFIVPDYAKYAAIDEDGTLWVYEYEPVNRSFYWIKDIPGSGYDKIAIFELGDTDWLTTLTEIK